MYVHKYVWVCLVFASYGKLLSCECVSLCLRMSCIWIVWQVTLMCMCVSCLCALHLNFMTSYSACMKVTRMHVCVCMYVSHIRTVWHATLRAWKNLRNLREKLVHHLWRVEGLSSSRRTRQGILYLQQQPPTAKRVSSGMAFVLVYMHTHTHTHTHIGKTCWRDIAPDKASCICSSSHTLEKGSVFCACVAVCMHVCVCVYV